MKKYYHLYSDGEKGVGFCESTQDFMAAMNRIAICQNKTGVVILAFAIEDTHVHFILLCTYEQCVCFERLFNKLSMMYLAYSRDEKPTVNLKFDVVEIEPEPGQGIEGMLCREIAYCIIQPTKDGKKEMPYDYLWSTGSMYFRREGTLPIWSISKNGEIGEMKTIGEISAWARTKLLHSTLPVPGFWTICHGLILPNNYVDVKAVERIFGSHNSFRYYMSRSKDEEVLRRMAKAKGVGLEDIEMRSATKELCKELFNKSSVRLLNVHQRLEIGRRLRNRYLCSLNQLSRIVHVPLVELSRYIG